MPILERVEASLAEFRPKNQREFVALQIARRFDDVDRLAQYLLVAPQHPKRVLLEAARLAASQAGPTVPAADRFFQLLEDFRKEAV